MTVYSIYKQVVRCGSFGVEGVCDDEEVYYGNDLSKVKEVFENIKHCDKVIKEDDMIYNKEYIAYTLVEVSYKEDTCDFDDFDELDVYYTNK